MLSIPDIYSISNHVVLFAFRPLLCSAETVHEYKSEDRKSEFKYWISHFPMLPASSVLKHYTGLSACLTRKTCRTLDGSLATLHRSIWSCKVKFCRCCYMLQNRCRSTHRLSESITNAVVDLPQTLQAENTVIRTSTSDMSAATWLDSIHLNRLFLADARL